MAERSDEGGREAIGEFYREVVAQSADGIFLVDVESRRILEANAALQRLLGYDQAEVVHLRLYDFVAHERAEVDRNIERILAEGGRFLGERRYRCKDGHLVDVEVSVNLVTSDERQVMCVVARDIAERKRAEEERRALEAQLHQAQKMEAVGQLTAGIAHNFNNLLTVISGNIELVAMEVQGEMLQCLEEAQQAADRAARMVAQMILFSQVMDVDMRPTSLAESVEEVVDICRSTFDRSIAIEYCGAADLPPVRGDAGQLRQAVMNLCLNARDALEALPTAGQEPRLCIEVEVVVLEELEAARHPQARAGAFLRLVVADNGVGMGEEARNRLFEPFFTTKGVGQGTGLGLSTVYAIVQQHEGWIEVESEPDRGTRFAVYLPAGAGTAATQGEMEQGRGETVLVVDDEAAVRRTLGKILRAGGYSVLQAADGLEALKHFAEEPSGIDLVLLDLSMPRMSGEEVLERVRQQSPHTRVLIYTGRVDVEPLVEAAADGLLKKPLMRHKLLREVRRALERERP